MVTMMDSRGKKTRTLPMVWFLLILVSVKFLMAGMQFTDTIGFPAMGGGEFSTILVPILGAWLGREYTSKVYP